MDLSQELDNLSLDPKVKGSINYAKARATIEAMAKNRAEKRVAKQIVIDFLKGKLEKGQPLRNGDHMPHKVLFPDGSVAKY